jgi:hypothetical protein
MKRLRIFHHHIYELRKGLRNLILFTASREHRAQIVAKLEACDIPYLIVPVAKGSHKINVFFGNRVCIEVLKRFGKRSLADFTAEEDFVLGIMLGYDRIRQCERYLRVVDRQARTVDDDSALDAMMEAEDLIP